MNDRETRLTDTFVALADTLVRDFDLTDLTATTGNRERLRNHARASSTPASEVAILVIQGVLTIDDLQ